MTLVTPYLPREAETMMKEWIKLGKQAFQVAVEHDYYSTCPNCGGIGLVFIRLMDAGPFRNPPATNKNVTWVNGGEAGRGWFVINKTMEFTCPNCHGNNNKPSNAKEIPMPANLRARVHALKAQLEHKEPEIVSRD